MQIQILFEMKLHYYTDMIIQICLRHAQCQLEIILSALSQLTPVNAYNGRQYTMRRQRRLSNKRQANNRNKRENN